MQYIYIYIYIYPYPFGLNSSLNIFSWNVNCLFVIFDSSNDSSDLGDVIDHIRSFTNQYDAYVIALQEFPSESWCDRVGYIEQAHLLQLHQMITEFPEPLPQDVIVEELSAMTRDKALDMLIGMHNEGMHNDGVVWASLLQ